jgi:hypothetical protein
MELLGFGHTIECFFNFIRRFQHMFLDDKGYIKKKWIGVIVSSTVIIPIIGLILWIMTFPIP